DVFLSFNSAQSAHAAAIYQRLTEAGLSIHYHARDVDLGQSFLTWMNDALKVSKRTLALASPLYFSDEAPWCQVEREAVLVTDPVSEKGKLVLVEIEPYPPEPIYDRLSKVTETSGLPPEEAAEALLAALKTRDARGNVVRWAAGPKALDFHAPDLDADGLEDVAEDLAIARAAAEALADSLAADDAPADDLKAAVEACRTHLDRAPARVRVGTVSTLYLRLRDQLLGQTPPAGQPRSNVVVAERSLRQLETLFHALRTLLRTLPGGAEAEKEMLALEGGKRPDADKAISVIDAMDGDARVDQTAVAMARILVRLSDHETQAGVAAGQTLLDLAHNFEIAIGDIIQEVSRARREGSDDPIKGDYMIGFVRDNEKVLRAFAMANIPAGEIWFDTLLALINKPGMP
ncbi:MAG: toll/interleukin-1 receptor domain-containing protein, partial [Pseudomonadota bacterium]